VLSAPAQGAGLVDPGDGLALSGLDDRSRGFQRRHARGCCGRPKLVGGAAFGQRLILAGAAGIALIVAGVAAVQFNSTAH
jgi:hypothetical protein